MTSDEEIKHIKNEVNKPKRELMYLINLLEHISKRHARGLEAVIAKLELWQNS